MKYTRPEAEIIELEMVDVIQTSEITGGNNDTPFLPASVDEDKNIPTI